MKRRFGWAIAIMVLALVAGGFYVYKRQHANSSNTPALSLLSPSDQQRLETALNSGNPGMQATVLTQDFAAAVHGQAVMSRDARISFQPDTFRSSGNDGVVDATVRQNGQEDDALVLFLSRTGPGQPWLVLSSLPQVAPSAYATNAQPAVAPSGKLTTQSAGCDPVAKGQTPVLFVHGLHEGPNVWGDPGDPKSLRAVVGSLPGVTGKVFNYSEQSLQWVTNPNIGAALATRIFCLSQSSRAAGNDSRVIVIAHSMGGLALKEAIKEQPQVAADLGLVVTIATPNDGSVIDSQLTQAVIDLCGLSATLSPLVGAVCGGGLLGPLNGASALRGLQVGSPELKALPNWPTTVPVYAIAGKIRPTFHFGFNTWYGNYSGSDTLVTVGSALHGQVVNGLGGTFGPLKCTTDAPWVLPLGLTSAPCDHNQLLHEASVVQAMVQETKAYLVEAQQSAAPQPQVCSQVFDAGVGWGNPQVQVTIQKGTVTCSEAVQVTKDFLSSDLGSSGANQIGIWGCATRGEPLPKVAGYCTSQNGEFTFAGM